MIVGKIKELNAKFDIWSLFSDFFFVIGVVVFGWNPVLLILWFMIDTCTMLIFANILIHKDKKGDWVDTAMFIIISPFLVFMLLGLYRGVESFIVELNMQEVVISDPNLVFGSYLFPIMLVCSSLGYYSEFRDDLLRMKNGTYAHSFLKHFFLKYILFFALILLMVAFYVYFEFGIVLLLIAMRAILRVNNKKWRTVL